MLKTKFEKAGDLLAECVIASNSWLMGHLDVSKSLDKLFSGFQELQFAVPARLNDKYGFISPWQYLFTEAERELESAMTLGLAGMYKEALRTIRSFLELNILGLYYFTTEDIESFFSWLAGQKPTPFFGSLIKELQEKNQRIKTLEMIGWSNLLYKRLYKDLSRYMHTGGHEGSHQSLTKTNVIQFNEAAFQTVLNHLFTAIRLVSIAWVANFPMSLRPLPLFQKFGFSGPVSGLLNNYQVGKIHAILDGENDDILKCLQKISCDDEESQTIEKQILEMEDLDENEIDATLKRWIDGLPADEQAKLRENLKDKELPLIYAMVTAMQKAFIRASTPVIVLHMLGLLPSAVNDSEH
jgi:hypothetical protein